VSSIDLAMMGRSTKLEVLDLAMVGRSMTIS